MKKTKPARYLLILSAVALLTFVSCLTTLTSVAETALSGQGTNRVTNAEAVQALKDALKEGISSASRQLSRTDGYFGSAVLKILLPPEAKPMMDAISKIPQGRKLIDDVVLRLNRAAEEAAKDVVPIFVDTITSMTIADGIAIVKGGNSAATDYLESKTRERLFNLYRPKVDTALGRPLVANISAKKSWETLSSAYNRAGTIPNTTAKALGKKEPMPKVTVDLSSYATNRALDGLFYKIAEEEAEIRKNPAAYASGMIKKVFGALKSGLL
ncbi:MAG: DUF4197 domain-containing protein [Spirochaetales bacterium]|nr:DUF4197 domain-containing protein [Spirochaetales bacterium]